MRSRLNQQRLRREKRGRMRGDPTDGRCDRVAVNAHAPGLNTQRDVALKRKGLSEGESEGAEGSGVCRGMDMVHIMQG